MLQWCSGRGPAAYRQGFSRRHFLQMGGLAVGGLTLADLLRWEARATPSAVHRGKSVIMVILGGGPSHVDLYDLKPEAPAEVRGEFAPIATTVPGMEISELLPAQAAIADKLALVRSLQMGTSFHNYLEITSGWMYGSGFGGVPRPAFGSVVSRLAGDGPATPGYVSLMGGWHGGESPYEENPAYLGPVHQPIVPDGPGLENLGLTPPVTLGRLQDRGTLLRSFDRLQRALDAEQLHSGDEFRSRALRIITSSQARDAFDTSREPAEVRSRYGLTPDLPAYNFEYPVLHSFLMARRLVEAGVRVVTMQAFGEWDTHSENFPTLRRLAPVVDQGFSALVTDLHERGLDRDVAVVLWGEFGRTPRISIYNGSAGRDHHGPANFALFAGGGLRTGQVVGATDHYGERPSDRPLGPQNVLATLYHVLGIDPALTLPDRQGRPMHLLDDRQPISELV